MDTSDMAKRMKEYEKNSRTSLMKRTPVIIRVDGKRFSKYTNTFVKPFDAVMVKAMQETMKYLCKNIQGCVLGYTQSDEISLVLVDYYDINVSPFYDNEVQKMCSIVASMTTLAFNRFFAEGVNELYYDMCCASLGDEPDEDKVEEYNAALKRYKNKTWNAMFDCRVFNIPKDEVTNYLFWRQTDASRNSVQAVAHVHFTQKELENVTVSQMQDILFTKKGINWNDYATELKRGSCCIKRKGKKNRKNWEIDREIPIFKGDGREYVERLINFP